MRVGSDMRGSIRVYRKTAAKAIRTGVRKTEDIKSRYFGRMEAGHAADNCRNI